MIELWKEIRWLAISNLRLGAPKDILPQRRALARRHRLSHLAFLELFGRRSVTPRITFCSITFS